MPTTKSGKAKKKQIKVDNKKPHISTMAMTATARYDCWSHPVGKSRAVCCRRRGNSKQVGAVANTGRPASQIASFGL